MGKNISLLLTAIMVSAMVSVPAMAAEEDLAGTWYAQSMEQDGTLMDASILASMGMNFTLVLNEDGTAVLSMGDQENECTWEGSILTMNDDQIPMELIDGELKIEQNGGTLIFGKDAPEPADVSLAPAVENPELNGFDGNWNAVTYAALGLPLPMKIATGMEFSLQIKDGTVLYTEKDYDLNNNSELTATIEKEFSATLEDEGTLFVDFNGEEILTNIISGPSGIRLTLHEDGKLSGEIPELTEAMEMLSGISQERENTDAEAADAADGEGSSAGSSGGQALSAFIIFEKAE